MIWKDILVWGIIGLLLWGTIKLLKGTENDKY